MLHEKFSQPSLIEDVVLIIGRKVNITPMLPKEILLFSTKKLNKNSPRLLHPMFLLGKNLISPCNQILLTDLQYLMNYSKQTFDNFKGCKSEILNRNQETFIS